MKLEVETTIEAVSAINRDLLVRTAHARVDDDNYVRCVEFGALSAQAQQLFVGRKVKITVELLPHTEP